MIRRRCAGSFLAIMAGLDAVHSAAAQAVVTEEQRETCAEAETRYRELFSWPSDREPVVVVLMYKHTFCPPQLTVRHGSTVRFVNVDRRTTHSVWFRDQGRSESDRLFSGEMVEMTLDLPPGEHTYLCGPHWQQERMIGTITIVP